MYTWTRTADALPPIDTVVIGHWFSDDCSAFTRLDADGNWREPHVAEGPPDLWFAFPKLPPMEAA